LFDTSLQWAVADLVVLTAAVTFTWYLHEQQASDIGGQTAARLLRGQVIEEEGTRFGAPAAHPVVRRRGWLGGCPVGQGAAQHGYQAGGVFAMILVQVLENVGMNIGLLPIAGIPLPLISYGGSATITTLAGLGIVQSVTVRRRMVVHEEPLPTNGKESLLGTITRRAQA